MKIVIILFKMRPVNMALNPALNVSFFPISSGMPWFEYCKWTEIPGKGHQHKACQGDQ